MVCNASNLLKNCHVCLQLCAKQYAAWKWDLACKKGKWCGTSECGVKLQERVPSKELRGRLEIEDIMSVLQWNWLQWYGHVLRKEDNDWWWNVWSMKWRIPGQEVDRRKIGEPYNVCVCVFFSYICSLSKRQTFKFRLFSLEMGTAITYKSGQMFKYACRKRLNSVEIRLDVQQNEKAP